MIKKLIGKLMLVAVVIIWWVGSIVRKIRQRILRSRIWFLRKRISRNDRSSWRLEARVDKLCDRLYRIQ